jgi:hypothetical protein
MPAPTVFSQVKVAPPPPNFSGDLKEVFALLEVNLQVKNPAGYNVFTVGGNAPTSDSGPWLKDGKEWYIWDTTTQAYIPQALDGALTRDIPDSATFPTAIPSSKMFFLTGTATGASGRQLYRWDGSQWVVVDMLRGTTPQRPVNPPPFTRYFDTSIGAEIFFKQGFGWVTVSGVPGDFKVTTLADEATALTFNPGWIIYASMKGRTPAGANGAVNGFTDRAVGSAFGEEFHTLTEAELAPHDHDILGKSQATSGGGDVGTVLPPTNASGATQTPMTEISGGGFGHNNIQPTLYLIALQKAQ